MTQSLLKGEGGEMADIQARVIEQLVTMETLIDTWNGPGLCSIPTQ